ncbi:MAG: hypothetical protein VX681_13915 [Myxococcota bacterium]|nr:hypothetical protein [Myxococcota bacterium]
MTISNTLRIPVLGLVLIGALSIVSTATAQTDRWLPTIDVERDADALRDEIRPRPHDVDVADTVLVFTNATAVERRVVCTAYDRSGVALGRVRSGLPAHGLRYMRASDFSNGRDFIGHAVCNTSGLVMPSAVLVGSQIENLNTRIDQREDATRLRFSLLVTY